MERYRSTWRRDTLGLSKPLEIVSTTPFLQLHLRRRPRLQFPRHLRDPLALWHGRWPTLIRPRLVARPGILASRIPHRHLRPHRPHADSLVSPRRPRHHHRQWFPHLWPHLTVQVLQWFPHLWPHLPHRYLGLGLTRPELCATRTAISYRYLGLGLTRPELCAKRTALLYRYLGLGLTQRHSLPPPHLPHPPHLAQ